MKKFLTLILIAILLFASTVWLCSCDDEVSGDESAAPNESEEIKLAEDHEIVDFELFAKAKKGITYSEVTKILNNPGKIASDMRDTRAYRLHDDLVAIIYFSSNTEKTPDQATVEKITIEPLVDPKNFERIITKLGEREYYTFNMHDYEDIGMGVQYTAGVNMRVYYLSDGRVGFLTFGGDHIVSGGDIADTPWFTP